MRARLGFLPMAAPREAPLPGTPAKLLWRPGGGLVNSGARPRSPEAAAAEASPRSSAASFRTKPASASVSALLRAREAWERGAAACAAAGAPAAAAPAGGTSHDTASTSAEAAACRWRAYAERTMRDCLCMPRALGSAPAAAVAAVAAGWGALPPDRWCPGLASADVQVASAAGSAGTNPLAALPGEPTRRRAGAAIGDVPPLRLHPS
mmetsp:Transcript_4840/g.20742  ORF Transcript_4840/g.20742 Transcript_4840/m.20742 type:complete len:208 (-) Transcript_4840:1427-2050(-)